MSTVTADEVTWAWTEPLQRFSWSRDLLRDAEAVGSVNELLDRAKATLNECGRLG